MIEVFRVAGGDVTGNPLIETKTTKEPKRSRQPLFTVKPLFFKSALGVSVIRKIHNRIFFSGHCITS